MRIAGLPILLLLVAGFGRGATHDRKVELGEAFTMRIGQEVVIRGDKLHIRFKSVRQDSRCPRGVTCVWAGTAEIEIEVYGKTAKRLEVTLNTGMEPKHIEYSGFEIKLLSLEPHPGKDEPVDPKKYEATLIVTKK